MNVKQNLITLQLLVVCIFQSKGMANNIVGIEMDSTVDSLVTTH